MVLSNSSGSVLVSCAGRRVGLVRAFQTDAAALGLDVRIIAADLNPSLSPACRIADDSVCVPRLNDPIYYTLLLEICATHDVRVIVPTIDTELGLLAERRDDLAQRGIVAVVSDAYFIGRATDKAQTPDLLASVRIGTPTSYRVGGLEFPVFIKPRDGGSSKGTHIAHSAAELMATHLANPQFIIQRYMDPRRYSEFTVDLYYDVSGRLRCLVPRLRIETRAGEISKGQTVRDELYDLLLERLGRWPGARGCVTLQVFSDKSREEIVGIEVNPRFGGGFPLSHEAGAHYPEWLMREYLLGESIPFFDSWRDGLLMLRYDEGLYLDASATGQ